VVTPSVITALLRSRIIRAAAPYRPNLPTCCCNLPPETTWSSKLNTAKAMGLAVPVNALSLADEVIE
jgi:hypothetical protein